MQWQSGIGNGLVVASKSRATDLCKCMRRQVSGLDYAASAQAARRLVQLACCAAWRDFGASVCAASDAPSAA